jgi:hypothetical protein
VTIGDIVTNSDQCWVLLLQASVMVGVMCLLVVVRMDCFASSVSVRLPSVNETGHSSEDFFDNKEFLHYAYVFRPHVSLLFGTLINSEVWQRITIIFCQLAGAFVP